MIIEFENKMPNLGSNVFIAPSAYIIGDVLLGNHVSVFFGAVIRGDILSISVGDETNIQEHALLHTSHDRAPTVIGRQVTVGHRAIVHGCRIEDQSLIGMGAIILDEAIVGHQCLIAAGTVVTEGKKIPPRSLVMGVPGKVVRSLSSDEVNGLQSSAENYKEKGLQYIDIFRDR